MCDSRISLSGLKAKRTHRHNSTIPQFSHNIRGKYVTWYVYKRTYRYGMAYTSSVYDQNCCPKPKKFSSTPYTSSAPLPPPPLYKLLMSPIWAKLLYRPNHASAFYPAPYMRPRHRFYCVPSVAVMVTKSEKKKIEKKRERNLTTNNLSLMRVWYLSLLPGSVAPWLRGSVYAFAITFNVLQRKMREKPGNNP